MTSVNQPENNGKECGLEAYTVGDHDTRPWGRYVVTGVGILEDGKEYCEKLITVEPGKILSLQSHNLRAEQWRVEEGTLTVVLDGTRLILDAGASVEVPLGAVHCMANLGDVSCKVYEMQMGTCREDDIIRYVDAYGRGSHVGAAEESVALFNEILAEIEA